MNELSYLKDCQSKQLQKQKTIALKQSRTLSKSLITYGLENCMKAISKNGKEIM